MIKFFRQAKEPVNSFTHFIGAILSIVAIFFMVSKAIKNNDSLLTLLSAVVFGVSMLLLYSASATYHYLSLDEQKTKIMRKLDHSMIFVLIAGTYTPISLNYFGKPNGIYFAIFMWCFALFGICLKLSPLNISRFISTALYIFMGWMILFDIPGFLSMPKGAIWLIFLGGIAYSVGAVMYGLKKPNLSKSLGFHELFHLFVILGSALHFFAIYCFIL